ncbi:hypothetical protein [Streptomyces sp. NPDC006784]|uniref:hypothetical protein n=1 Tax=Streptomyces sp. NPDC006784 TaxID=3364764 RepID=UPI0036ADEC93
MKRTVIAACSAAVLLAAAGCGSSDEATKTDSDSRPSGKPLSEKWQPKIQAAKDKAPTSVCENVGSTECADYLSGIVIAVYRLRDELDDGAKDRYPRTVKRIKKIDRASTDYTKHECKGDPNAGMEGSPCPKHVADIVAGSSALLMEMGMDEAKASAG